jgi:hypothetical protein
MMHKARHGMEVNEGKGNKLGQQFGSDRSPRIVEGNLSSELGERFHALLPRGVPPIYAPASSSILFPGFFGLPQSGMIP